MMAKGSYLLIYSLDTSKVTTLGIFSENSSVVEAELIQEIYFHSCNQ
jgi:hypothetical protein